MSIYNTLLPGDLLFTRDAGFVGKGIRFGERRKYLGWGPALKLFVKSLFQKETPEAESSPTFGNHIAVVVDNNEIIEALANGLVVNPVTKYAETDFGVLRLSAVKPDVTDADRAAVVAFARAELARHDGYGWLGIFSIFIQLLTPLKLDISWDGTLICSAFGARAWEHAGVIIPTLSPYTTLPTDLALLAGELFAGKKNPVEASVGPTKK